ncbi:MAG: hypothetical protein KC549_04045 [Myxococcales bacterium]|nr:hypothetical protein [Myxococcales bacterium]MCB9546775.1 hypothetical protein [Myxococcales bacterium]
MTRWVLALALLAVGCDDGGGSASPEPDAETRPDMMRRVIVDMAAPDAAPMDDAALADAGPADEGVAVDRGPVSACSDGLDNDRDGRVDFPDDPGCVDAADDDEADPVPRPQCADGLDNDEDGERDLADPDCTGPGDPSESGMNPVTVCHNQLDDDGDGLIDFPFDPGCFAAGHNSEADPSPRPACANGEDDDQNGVADFPADPGCQGAGDEEEAPVDPAPACANGEDDDGSGATDWPDDLGCDGAGDASEVSPCGPGAFVIDLNRHLEANAAYDGDLTGAPANLVASCGGGAGGERVFSYEVREPLDRLVFNTRHPETEAPVVLALRDRCGGADVQCDRGLADDPGVAITLENPPLGRLFVIVDTGSRQQVGRFRLTVDAVRPPACRDGADNDGDGQVDLADPGCTESEDPDEADPDEPPVCANDLDDDGDGRVDWPADPDCVAAGGPEEAPPCGLDIPFVRVGQAGGDFPVGPVQGPGAAAARCEAALGAETVIVLTLSEPSDVDFQVLTPEGAPAQVTLHARQACEDPMSEIGCRTQARLMDNLTLRDLDRGTWYLFAEQGLVAPRAPLVARVVVRSNLGECNDELDNDFDGLVDRDDPGCENGRDPSERDPGMPTECSDGIDNDGNGQIDYPDDAGCEAAGDLFETPPCQGEFFGDVCVVFLSAQCVGGSARQICLDNGGGEVITFAEFQAVVAAGWVRPDASYHTMAVTEYAQCDGGFGNVGIPGWGQFNLFQCGENVNYCNRAVMCVTR